MTGRTPAMTSTTSSALARTEKMRAGRQADSARRRQRVITAINQAAAAGTEISVAGIARAADVDRTGLLGEQAWQQSGLGAPADIDTLNSKITQLEQQAADLRIQLSERDDELAAARAANRELMTRINHNPRTR